MKLIIEKGVPLPDCYRTGLATAMREALTAMKPGDCVTIIVNKLRPAKKITNAFFFVRKKPTLKDRHFISASVKLPSGGDAIRIWEIEPPKF